MEYIFLIGIAVLVLFYMGPAFKRGVQSLVKASADQIGNQANADQEVVKPSAQRAVKDWDVTSQGQGGYLVGSNSAMSMNAIDTRTDRLYVTNSVFHEDQETITNSVTNLGITND